jgi:hypothetical protein
MRMPALRLPAWRPSLDWSEGLGSRSTLLYGLYTFVLFCVFLFANLPHKVLVQRVLHSTRAGALDVVDARFAWWRGLELQHAGRADRSTQPAFFESASIRAARHRRSRAPAQSRPQWHLYGGTLDGTPATAR